MNDRELMKRIYDRDCADELSAEELLSAAGRGARIRTRYAGLVAAAVICIVAVGGLLWLKNSADNRLTPADNISQGRIETEEDILLNSAYDPRAEGKIVFYRKSDGKTVTVDMTEYMLDAVRQFDLDHGSSIIRSKDYDTEALRQRTAAADIVARVCFISKNGFGSKVCLTKLYSNGQRDSGFVAMYEDEDGIRHYSEEGYRAVDRDGLLVDMEFDSSYLGIAEQFGGVLDDFILTETSNGYTKTYLSTHPHVLYNDKLYFSNVSGVPADTYNVTRYPVTDEYLRYLSTLKPIGTTIDFGNYLRSEWLIRPCFVFKSRTSDTFYAYTSKCIYKFGEGDDPDIPEEAEYTFEPKSYYIKGENSYYFIYKSTRFTYSESCKKEYSFESQTELYDTDAAHLLDGTVFLGTMKGIYDMPDNGVSGNGAEYGSAVFYNSEKEMMIAISVSESLTGLRVVTYSPENRVPTD